MHPRAEEFAAEADARYDLSVDVHEFPAGTKTASDAAAALGCDVGRIAKTIVLDADEVVLAVTSGANRVDPAHIATVRDHPPSAVSMADPDTVRETVGWSVGGVPPCCHRQPVPTYFDRSLLDYDRIWAAAGTPRTVFPVAPQRLLEVTEATTLDLAEH